MPLFPKGMFKKKSARRAWFYLQVASVPSSLVKFLHKPEKNSQRWTLFWKTSHALCFPGLGHKMKLLYTHLIPLTNSMCHFSLHTAQGSLKLQIARKQVIEKWSWLLLETGGRHLQRNLDLMFVCLTDILSSSLRERRSIWRHGEFPPGGGCLPPVAGMGWPRFFLVSQWSPRRLAVLRGQQCLNYMCT